MTATLATFKEFPLPGVQLNTAEVVVASCWQSDDEVGLVLLGIVPGSYYSVVLAERCGPLAYVEYFRRRFPNIVPTAAFYEEITGCWGED